MYTNRVPIPITRQHILVLTLCGALFCGAVCLSAEPGLPWDQCLVRKLIPRGEVLQEQLRQVEEDVELLPSISVEDSGGTGGFVAFFPTAGSVGKESPRTIELRWKAPAAVDLVALVPARKYHVNGVALDYGLPDAFSVELIDGEGSCVAPVSVEKDVRVRPVRDGYPFVYTLPQPVMASGLRITVNRLQGEFSEDDVNYVLAFSEIFCFSGKNRVTRHAKTTSSFEMGKFYHWHWRLGFLNDGQTPLGLPEIPEEDHWEIGWLSKDRSSENDAAWVTVDLGERREFDRLRLYPIRRPSLDDVPGFGMPIRFSVDVSNTENFEKSTRVLDHTHQNLKNRGYNPVALSFPQIKARYVRFEASKLWKAYDDYPAFLAFSEIEILKGTENIALGAHVVSSDQIGRVKAHGRLYWSEESLTDGKGPEGRLVGTRDWLQGLASRLELEKRAFELRGEMDGISANFRRWFMGVGLVLGGGGIFFSLLFPFRSRMLRRKEIHNVRERIAGDLHDEIGSNLGSIQILSALAEEQMPDSEELKTIQSVAAETVTAVRDIVWLLRARSTQRALVADHLRETGGILLEPLEWTFQADQDVGDFFVSDARLRDLMLFYREALYNLTRHAKAKTAEVRLYIDQGHLVLFIEDHGCGMSDDLLEKPGTLRALKQRAERLSGRLEVHSVPKEGTRLTLHIPAHPDSPYFKQGSSPHG